MSNKLSDKERVQKFIDGMNITFGRGADIVRKVKEELETPLTEDNESKKVDFAKRVVSQIMHGDFSSAERHALIKSDVVLDLMNSVVVAVEKEQSKYFKAQDEKREAERRARAVEYAKWYDKHYNRQKTGRK